MKLYFKKYVPLYRADNIICIGFAARKNYLELPFNTENNKLLKQLLEFGIETEDLSHPIYKQFYEQNFLEDKKRGDNKDINRGELFLDYLCGVELTEEIKASKILIFGAGAGGSSLIYLLAQMGFKNISIVDFDIVNESDIHRVTIFDRTDLGKLKIEALRDKIDRNFGIQLNCINAAFTEYNDLESVIDDCKADFVVKACDPIALFRVNLNKICFKKRIPHFSLAYSFTSLMIGPLYAPGFTSCDESFNTLQKETFGEHYDLSKDGKLFSEHLVHPSISFNINTVASLALKEMLLFFLGQYQYCFTIGQLVQFSPISLDYRAFPAKCKEDCSICTPAKKEMELVLE